MKRNTEGGCVMRRDFKSLNQKIVIIKVEYPISTLF